ncbi:MAG TPA: hypothetical protein VHM24_02870 [Gemmatimonadaceae bacterium]|nr:hypothetical protein [Gemmatimonadaceae bacterium]
MTQDERFDEFIRKAADDYNRPPATPKDEMWNVIVSAQTNAMPRLHITTGGNSRSGPAERQNEAAIFAPRVAWLGWAAAAMLLLATGVGIGRWTNGSARATARNVAATQPTEQQSSTPVESPAEPVDAPKSPLDPLTVASSRPTDAPEESPAAVTGRRVRPQPKQRSRQEILRNPQVVGSGSLTRVANNRVRPNGTGQLAAPANMTYQVATQRHLADAEALLTSFSLGSRDSRMDAQFAGWAKGLLSNTRLLLDSPAGDDPRRARLLQDLELVLAQIVQLSPDAAAQDRELIQGSIQSGQVMTRLRSAIPAGQPER